MTQTKTRQLPVVEELPDWMDVEAAIERLWNRPGLAVLQSALNMPGLGRYSFVTCDPFATIQITRPQADPLAGVSKLMRQHATEPEPGLPPFQGGAVGMFGFEFGRCFERVPRAAHDEFGLPLAVVHFYSTVLSWDHESRRAWIVAQGFPARNERERSTQAVRDVGRFRQWLLSEPIERRWSGHPLHAAAHGLTAPQFATRLGKAWIGNFDSAGFRQAIDRAREYIYDGDIFQVNLAQRLMRSEFCSPIDLYLHLVRANPAPFAGLFDLGNAYVVSSSPERFLKVDRRRIESRPIKGTRRRNLESPDLDAAVAAELANSEKDRAENTMIVDLIRNDLSKICSPESVRVAELCSLETYPYVFHLVSSIEGELARGAQPVDIIPAVFPGGSITGAPKVRAMEIISELEPTVRGPYCGSLGYLGFDGSVDLNILIRTITTSCGWWQLQVGAGIVADSNSEAEEDETWAKAVGIIAAIERARGSR